MIITRSRTGSGDAPVALPDPTISSVDVSAHRRVGHWKAFAPSSFRLLSSDVAVPILLVAAVVAAALLRFVDLHALPPGFNQDEAVNGYDAYSLFLTGRDHHGHPFPFAGLESFGDWASPLLTFLTAPVVGVAGLRIEVVRAVAAAVGVLAVPIVYLLARELFQRPSIALVAAWLIAVSPWAVHRSRFANPAAMVPTMVALTMLAVVWTANRRSPRGAVAVAIAAVLAIASYPTLKLYVPLLLLAAGAIYWRTFASFRPAALCQAAAIVILVAGPILYLSLADPAGRSRLDQVSIFNRTDVSAALLLRQYKSYVSPRLLFQTGNGHPGQTPTPPGQGIEPLFTLPILVAGLISLTMTALRRGGGSEWRAALFVLSALVLYPIPGSLTVPARHMGRGVQLIPLLAIAGAVGAVAIIDAVRWTLRRHPRLAARCAVVTGLVLAGLLGWDLRARYEDYFAAYASRPRVLEYFQFGLEPAIAFMRDHEREYDEMWLAGVNQPYIYVLFFNRWSPSDVHEHLRVRRQPPLFSEVDAIGRYHFGFPPDIAPTALPVLFSITYPRGETAFTIRGGSAGGKRMLLVSRTVAQPLADEH